MGRKIPGRKHRGIKDPYEQQAKRNESLIRKINAPPEDPDEQDIPKSVQRIMHLKQEVKDRKFVYKRKKKNKAKSKLINTAVMAERDVKLPGMTRPDKPAPEFVQRPGESNYFFLHRIEMACREVIKENKFEEKFGVEVNRNPETGEVISVTKMPKDKIVAMVKDSAKESKSERKKKNKKIETLTKKEKRKMKLLAKKQAKMDNKDVDGFEQFKDEVKFGEVVHQPPVFKKTLKLKTKVKTPDGRPGKKDLLLKPLLQMESDSQDNLSLSKTKTVDLTGKRKGIPVGAQRQLETQRLEAVNAYRMLKGKKLLQGNER